MKHRDRRQRIRHEHNRMHLSTRVKGGYEKNKNSMQTKRERGTSLSLLVENLREEGGGWMEAGFGQEGVWERRMVTDLKSV